MENGRGINEGDLVEEIIELWKDVRMYCDKISIYDNGNGEINDDDGRTVRLLYLKHVLSLDKIRLLIMMGRKYFPHRDVYWDSYAPEKKANVISFESETMIGRLNGEKEDYLTATADDDFLGFK
jgi:hypothetical protein